MTTGGFEAALDPGALTPGTTVLVTGPALSGKREVLLSLLGAGTPEERGTVFVTTRQTADAAARALAETDPGVPSDRLSLVDCVSRQSALDGVRDSAERRFVSDPGDMTGIGIAVTEFFRENHRRGWPSWFGFHSLSTTLMYAGVRPAFRFLHVTLGRVRSVDGVALVALDDSTVESTDLAILSQPFDGRLEVREQDGRDEVRARGVDVAPRDWTALREVAEF